MKKRIVVFVFLLILINFVSAVQVVEVQPPQEEKQGFFANTFGFLREPVFWYIVIAVVIITAIAVILFFLIRWLITFLKARNDLFFMLKKDRIKLAKIQRRYNSTHWWRIKKNIPIRLIKKQGDKLMVSKPFAYHRGDYTTNEGNVLIALNMEGKNKFLVFPDTDILVILNREKVKIEQLNDKGERKIIALTKLPKAKDIVQFNENEILIFAESLSKVGQFLIPVLKTEDGKIIDLAMPTFETLKEVVLGDYLYVQTDEFGKLAKQSMNINPNVRAMTKVGDSNQQVDIQGAEGI